jgi:hypothetical protein
LKTIHEIFYSFHTTMLIRKSALHSGILLLALLWILTGCGLFAASDEPDGPLAIRTAQPTFTPTVAATAAAPVQPTAPLQEATPAPGAASPQDATRAKAVINGPLVNARSGPGTDFDIIGEIERGEEFDIVGVSPDRAWWQICCFNDAQAWVTSEFVDTLGLVDSVPVVGGEATEAGTVADTEQVTEQATGLANTPTADAAPAAPAAPAATAVPAPAVNFDLETQEQFPETGVVRIFLYAYAGNSALEGYSLSVTKDGAALPVEGASFGGQPAFTWPFQDPRQRFQNFKVEYPDTPAQGVWQVQLIDSTGATVGPPATFTLTSNDPEQELYVRYAQR